MSELSAPQQRALTELFQLTPVIGELGAVFREAGHQLYLVGGSVRDALLGRLGNDLDFTTSAKPDETQPLLERYTPAVWDIGKEWGTIGALKRGPHHRETKPAANHDPHALGDGDWLIEITTFRSDTYRSDSRKPTVMYGENVQGDLMRRDFTINAMAIDVSHPSGTPQLIDPYDGLEDLADHIIRTPSTPELSFSDDPLRMMRAARFASQLVFEVSADVRAAMKDMAERITIISAERVQAELTKLLLTNDPARGLDLLVSTGIADYVLPELPALRLERDEHAMHKDIYAHTLVVLQQAITLEQKRGHAPDLINRLAALLHDIGKPATRRTEHGKVSFLYHDIVGAKLARKRLKALKYSNDIVDAVTQLVEQHLRFHGYGEQEWTDAAVRRYVHDAGDQLERLHMLTRADCTTRNAAKATRLRRAYDELEFRIDELKKQEELNAIRPDLDGAEIMKLLGIKPGPVVGEAYRFLLDRRMTEGPLGAERAREELLAWWTARGEE